ncbi:MAG TPA: hypothetical protein PK018_16450, partial [Candidatus Competibacter sp.]|nr:hypothetical protein [Candidatus Competibacter sp.]
RRRWVAHRKNSRDGRKRRSASAGATAWKISCHVPDKPELFYSYSKIGQAHQTPWNINNQLYP